MLRKKHIKEELGEAKKVFMNKESTLEQKVYAIYRLLQANLKVAANNRVNTVRIMEKLEIPMITPEIRISEATETTTGTDGSKRDITTINNRESTDKKEE